MVDSVNESPREIADAARLLRQVGRLHVRSQRATAACCCGSSSARCHVLGELAQSGPLPVTDLAGRIGADKGWTSRAVRDLVREGLLSRQAAPGDARVVKVGLTARGRRRWSAIDAVLQREAVSVFSRLASADLSKVIESLALLSHAFEEHERGRKGRLPCAQGAKAP